MKGFEPGGGGGQTSALPELVPMLNWVVLRMKVLGSEQKSLRAWPCGAAGVTSGGGGGGGPRGTDEAKAAVSRRADRLTHLPVPVSDSGSPHACEYRPERFP